MLSLTLALGCVHACAQDGAASRAASVTLAVFSDPHTVPMANERWLALETAIRAESQRPEARGLGAAEILRGDRIVPGLTVGNPVTVYLHGDCQTAPPSHFAPPAAISNTLGWVVEKDGRIQPFIHVDCRRIGQMLWMRGNFCDGPGRERLMADAVARVIVHEWIHIATQNAGHARNGVAKAHFGVEDLAPSVRGETLGSGGTAARAGD
jgi:hypothetical protein